MYSIDKIIKCSFLADIMQCSKHMLSVDLFKVDNIFWQ